MKIIPDHPGAILTKIMCAHWVAEVDRWLDFKDVVDLYTVINHRWYEMGFNGVLWWLNGI